MKRIFTASRRILLALADVALGLVVAMSAASILGSVAWFFELATHFVPYVFVAACVVVLANLLFGRWVRALAGLAIAIFAGVQLKPFYHPASEDLRVAGAPVYKVLLINLKRDNRKPEKVVDFLRSEKADLLLLQEVTPKWIDKLRPVVADYGSEVLEPRDHAFGFWLLSRQPLSDVRVLPGEDARVPFVTATIVLGGKPVRLVGIHPVPPTSRSKAKDRNDRLSSAADALSKEKAHRMILGDLNCSPWSPHFKRLVGHAGVRDTALGRGIDATWKPGLPFFGLPLDHCLVSKGITVVSRTVGPDVGSDHRPLAVEFLLGEIPSKPGSRAP